jgi:hypothetical protein
MKRQKECLITQTKDVTVYADETSNVPSSMKIGGYITVVNNHNSEERWKEWKWYKYEDGTIFNDRQYVIDMLVNFVSNLHLKD